MIFHKVAQVSSKPGSTIGSYVVERKLGTGGMAEVFLARKAGPHGFEKRVAIKRMLPQLSSEPEIVRMFCAEARLLASLNHSNIAQILDFIDDRGELSMVLEFVDGPSCAALLHSVSAKHARVPAGPALYIAREVLRALTCAHEARGADGRPLGIVHRDVSPSNILFGKRGAVKLIDFGITRSTLDARTTYPGELRGKLRYMAPEQVVGTEVDARTDIFTVGIVLAELLMGRPLFPGHTDFEVLTLVTTGDLTRLWAAELPPDLVGILSVALSVDPSRRFRTAWEFSHQIDAIARARGVALEDSSLMRYLAAACPAAEPVALQPQQAAAPTIPAGPLRPPPPPSARRHQAPQ